MGALKDLGTSAVKDICPKTGYPRDEKGYLLNPYSPEHNILVEGWDKHGTELFNLTNPYGLLEFAIGEKDDFWCFDCAFLEQHIILHATVHGEIGCFLDAFTYVIIPFKLYDYDALGFTDQAIDWLQWNGIKHHKKGWNQDLYYFHRAVHHAFIKATAEHADEIPEFSEDELRFGGERIDRFCNIAHLA
jgi:hypothetical protein